MSVRRNRRVLLLALLLATVSAFVVYTLMASRPDPAPATIAAPPTGDPVLVSTRAIQPGEAIGVTDIEIAYVAPEVVESRALAAADQAVGHVALAEIAKGQQIQAGSLGEALASAPETFAKDVPVGMRAVSIALEETVGAGGFVQPGDRVDVIASYELQPVSNVPPGFAALTGLVGPVNENKSSEDDSKGEDATDSDESSSSDDEPDPFAVAELLVQDVEVLAVGQALDATSPAAAPSSADEEAPAPAGAPAPRPEATSVTLLVSPSQALRLLLAVEAESIFRLLLRAPGDESTTELPPALITSGQVPMEPFALLGANLAPTDLVITDARFRETSVAAGGTLEFVATVQNISSHLIPAGRGGIGPGHVYAAGETWQSLSDESPRGSYSVGVTLDNIGEQTYPWRWELGEDLPPGATTTISGGIPVPNAPGVRQAWFGTLLQPGTLLSDGVAPAQITIEAASSVVVNGDNIDLRTSPWPDAASLQTLTRGTRADVLEFEDGWFHVRVGDREGWVSAAFVENAALSDEATPSDAREEGSA